MIGAPGALLRAPRPDEAEAVQAVWEASLNRDDPASWPRGGWSVEGWATATRVLLLRNRLVGVAAVRAEAGAGRVVASRVALEVAYRQPPLPGLLVGACVDLAQADAGAGVGTGVTGVRLWIPEGADWAETAASEAGFEPIRSAYHMLLPPEAPVPKAGSMAGVRMRSIRPGEEERVLQALNRAWDGTWDFVPIRLDMLEHDLEGQREGMLLGVEEGDDEHIIATCHAVFDASEQNPDGNPRAWISNLTVDPDWRGRGLARAMLAAGVTHLRQRGARSVTLGVDAGDPAPLRLYQSAGFRQVSSTTAWDRRLQASSAA